MKKQGIKFHMKAEIEKILPAGASALLAPLGDRLAHSRLQLGALRFRSA